MSVSVRSFGKTRDGAAVSCWTLQNKNGMQAEILDYGGIVRTLTVPDRCGVPTDVVLGYDTLAEYEEGSSSFGAFIGRYANRIGGSAFPLGGRSYPLKKNDGDNHLHGIFSRCIYTVSPQTDGVILRRRSNALEEGFPGTLDVAVRYSLTSENALIIDYSAVTDRPTVLNLTNHSYFNLAGHSAGFIGTHLLTLTCDRYTQADRFSIPTGKILPVEGTLLDFRHPRPLGEGLRAGDPLLQQYGGYDHNLIFPENGKTPQGLLYCPESGIAMRFSTTQPAVQLYTGNFLALDRVGHGKGGAVYVPHGGVCLEAQHYPDSPNHPDFPSTLLNPDERYRHSTVYSFFCP